MQLDFSKVNGSQGKQTESCVYRNSASWGIASFLKYGDLELQPVWAGLEEPQQMHGARPCSTGFRDGLWAPGGFEVRLVSCSL